MNGLKALFLTMVLLTTIGSQACAGETPTERSSGEQARTLAPAATLAPISTGGETTGLQAADTNSGEEDPDQTRLLGTQSTMAIQAATPRITETPDGTDVPRVPTRERPTPTPIPSLPTTILRWKAPTNNDGQPSPTPTQEAHAAPSLGAEDVIPEWGYKNHPGMTKKILALPWASGPLTAFQINAVELLMTDLTQP